MHTIVRRLVLASAFLIASLPGVPLAAPANCAFLDVNDDGLLGPGDVVVTDSQWLGGAPFSTPHPFVVPAGCALPDLVAVLPPLQGVQVTATKITFLGSLNYLPPGGRGVVLIADPALVPQPAGLGDGSIKIGDGVTSKVKIEAGGRNSLAASTRAVPQKAVALIAAGTCSINNAELIGNRPLQDTGVGVLCRGDLTIRMSVIKGSLVNIQSVTGKIDARSSWPTEVNLAYACDDPSLNVLGGGNRNGVLDEPDFPCQIDLAGVGPTPGLSPVFTGAAALLEFCKDATTTGRNAFQAISESLIVIAKENLELRGVAGGAAGRTEAYGKARVTLVSETGNVDTAYTDVHHGPAAPGGARSWLFASPTSVTFLPFDHEDVSGPSGLGGATTDITDACYEGPNPVQVGRRGDGTLPLVGAPAPAPCKQPAGFVPVLIGNF